MDYIYGKLCQKVKEVEYSGGTTDTIQVSVDNDTNVITANYIGEKPDVTKEYVDEQIAGLSTKYLSLTGGTMRGALVLENEGYSTTIDGQHITIEDEGTEVLFIDSGFIKAGSIQAKEVMGYNSEDNATAATFNGVSIGHIQDSSAEDRSYDIGKSSTLEIQAPLIEIGKNNEGVREDIRITGIASPTNNNDAVNKSYVDNLVYVQNAPEWGAGGEWEVTAEELQKLKTAPVIMITNYGMLNGIVVNKEISENYVELYAVGRDISSDWQARIDSGVFYLQGTEPPSIND